MWELLDERNLPSWPNLTLPIGPRNWWFTVLLTRGQRSRTHNFGALPLILSIQLRILFDRPHDSRGSFLDLAVEPPLIPYSLKGRIHTVRIDLRKDHHEGKN